MQQIPDERPLIGAFLSTVVLVAVMLGSLPAYGEEADPYRRILVAHRFVQVSYEGILEKSSKWEEPLRSALLEEFSRDNLTIISVDVLNNYISEEQAEALAQFLESALGQKFVAASYGEYDLRNLSADEERELDEFPETEAGMAYMFFTYHGLDEYHDVIRERAQAVVDRYRQ